MDNLFAYLKVIVVGSILGLGFYIYGVGMTYAYPAIVHGFAIESWLWGFVDWSAHLPWWVYSLLKATEVALDKATKKKGV